MLCFIYRSKRWDGAYLYLKTKDDFTLVPETLRKQFGTPIYVMSLFLTPQQKLAIMDSAELKKTLAEKGYYFQLTTDLYEKVNQKNE